MKNLPAKDNEVALVHGDFRLDNLIFHPTEVQLLEQLLVEIFWVWSFTKLCLMSLGTCDSSVGLGAVYHWAALRRLGLLPYVPLLACQPSRQHNGQLERNRRWWYQITAQNSITSIENFSNRWTYSVLPCFVSVIFLVFPFLSPYPTNEQVYQLRVTWSPFTTSAEGSHLLCHSWISTWPSLSLK